MDKLRMKNIAFAIVLLCLLGCGQVAFADDVLPGQPGASSQDSVAPGNLVPELPQPPLQAPAPALVSLGPPTPLSTGAGAPTIPVITDNDPNSAVQSGPLTYRESQTTMLNSVPTVATPSADASAAFNALMQQNMPLTPQQVIRLRQLIDLSQRAASTPPTVPPKPVSTTIMINLAPGTTPPAIRLAKGYVSSLVFVDSTGAPWPIASFEIGDPKATNIQWDGKSNVVLIQAATTYSDGNIVIRLAGLMTPITLELVSGQRVVDYRADIHVSGIGPNTKDLPTGNGLPMGANQLLLNVLDGVAPPGSKALIVKGGEGQAWLMGDKMYLRTRLTLLSPGWVGKMVSPDGMYAYELQRSSSVLVSQYGEPIELKIEGF
jgi:intracellular multiplication protein IcmK